MPLEADNDNQPARYGPWLPTKALARSCGAKSFFTGIACRHGHLAERYAADGSCMQCKAEYREAHRSKLAEQARQWRLDNPEKAKSYGKDEHAREVRKAHYEKTRDHQIAKAIAWNKANPEKVAEGMRRWYVRNGDRQREKAREEYAANPEYHREMAREWRLKNAEKHRENSRRWRRENPEKAAASTRNKKAMRRQAPGRHTADDVAAILKRQAFKCVECGVSIKKRVDRHVDHIIPLSRGGTNWPSNLQILCAACNMHKHATDPIDFARRKGRLL